MEAAEGLDPDKNKLDDFEVVDLFCQADRLYIQVQANWYQDGEYHMACQMFSQGRKSRICVMKRSLPPVWDLMGREGERLYMIQE